MGNKDLILEIELFLYIQIKRCMFPRLIFCLISELGLTGHFKFSCQNSK